MASSAVPHEHYHHGNELEHHDENEKCEKHELKEKEHHEHKHKHEHKNQNIYAIYIHILADTLGSVAVLISAFLIKYYHLHISDPICSLFISAMIIFSTIPVLKSASMTLLHIPNEKIIKKKKKVEQSIKNIKCGMNSKPSIGNFELWQTNSSYFVGEIKIEIPIDKMEQKENEDETNEKLQKENNLFFEVQSKIQTIFKDNKINEYYIEIV